MDTRLIINVRGMNGSGKTHAVRGMLGDDPLQFTFDELQAWLPLAGEPPLPGTLGDYAAKPNEVLATLGFTPDGRTIIALGRYDKPTGGCDAINKQDHTCNRVREFATRFDIVLFEGIIVSMTWGRYADLFNDVYQKGIETIIAYLDPTEALRHE